MCPKFRTDAKPKKHTQPLPYKLLNTKIRHLSKQRILYIQFSALVKSNARMFNCGDNTHRDCLFRTIPCSALNLPPLSKGGGLTARHKLSLCCILLAIRPPFYSPNFSAVKTEGLLYTTNPSKSALSHPLFVGQVSMCAYMALHSHYPTRFS